MADAVVLVVDDDPYVRELLRSLLREALGVRVILAADGAEALERVAEVSPSLVILDMMMPKLNGLQVLATLQSQPSTRDIPVIGLSAVSGMLLGARKAGCADCLDKPFDIDQLLARVRSHLHQVPKAGTGWPSAALKSN